LYFLSTALLFWSQQARRELLELLGGPFAFSGIFLVLSFHPSFANSIIIRRLVIRPT
jgi:hypothetical protein